MGPSGSVSGVSTRTRLLLLPPRFVVFLTDDLVGEGEGEDIGNGEDGRDDDVVEIGGVVGVEIGVRREEIMRGFCGEGGRDGVDGVGAVLLE